MKKTFFILLVLLGFSLAGSSQSLGDYFEMAAENNPGLKAKYKIFEASLQKAAQVGSLPDPNLSFGYFISPVETRVGPQQAKFSLTQMFPWFGTLKAQEDAASFLAEAKYREFVDAKNKLKYEVAAAFFPLYELNKLVTIEAENIEILAAYKDIATVKYENGKSTMVDVLRVEMMLSDAQTNLSILEQKKKPLSTQFNKLLNRHDSIEIRIADNLSFEKLELNYRKDSLLVSNPLLEELNLKIQASEASQLAIRRQGLPKVGLGLDYVIVGKREGVDIPDNGQDAFMPMVSVSLPIFRGKYNAASREAQLMQESFKLQKEDVTNRLTSTYDMSWFEIQKQAELLQLYEEQTETSENSLLLLFSAYSNSGKDFEEVLRMQQQVLKYERMKATALAEYHIAIAQLEYITAK